MESALPLLLFFGGLFILGLLIVISTYQSREIERSEAAEREAQRLALQENRPFLRPVIHPLHRDEESTDSGPSASPERVSSYLREQLEAAHRFVEEPSIQELYRSTVPAPDSLQGVTEFLDAETEAAAAFLSEPSLDGLYRPLPPSRRASA